MHRAHRICTSPVGFCILNRDMALHKEFSRPINDFRSRRWPLRDSLLHIPTRRAGHGFEWSVDWYTSVLPTSIDWTSLCIRDPESRQMRIVSTVSNNGLEKAQ